MNKESMSFEEAKKLSVKKWKSIKSKILSIFNSLTDDCGFCERIDILYPNSEYARECPQCEAKKPCCNDISPIDDALCDAIEHTETLIEKIEALKEKNKQ